MSQLESSVWMEVLPELTLKLNDMELWETQAVNMWKFAFSGEKHM